MILGAAALVAAVAVSCAKPPDDRVRKVRAAFADLTIRAAEKVIDRSLDKEAHRQIIEQVLTESTTLKKEQK